MIRKVGLSVEKSLIGVGKAERNLIEIGNVWWTVSTFVGRFHLKSVVNGIFDESTRSAKGGWKLHENQLKAMRYNARHANHINVNSERNKIPTFCWFASFFNNLKIFRIASHSMLAFHFAFNVYFAGMFIFGHIYPHQFQFGFAYKSRKRTKRNRQTNEWKKNANQQK